MKEWDLAEALIRDNVLAVRALTALQIQQLDDPIRKLVTEALANGNARVELRTRVETGQTELVLVPTDGTEVLWLARTT